MHSLEHEISSFQSEVERVAADLIRSGEAAPFDAVIKAREIVMRQRQIRQRRAQAEPPQ